MSIRLSTLDNLSALPANDLQETESDGISLFIGMIYVFPVSTSDSSLIDPLYEAIKHLGGMRGRKCVVIGDQKSRDSVDWLVNRLEHLDAKVESHVFPFDCSNGWPRACNRYFVAACSIMGKQDQPFYFFELDNTPLRPGWLDKIEGEYMAGMAQGKTFMGRMSPYLENRMGVWRENGMVMNGSGVYPANFISKSLLMRDVASQGIPWDVYMRWEIVNSCKNASDFILFNWHSTHYRWENGALICDIDKRPGGILHNGKTEPIAPGHFLVHGCKDGSLSRLVVSGQIDAPPAMTDFKPQDGQVRLSRSPHKPEIVGSNPTPATTPKATKPKKKRVLKLSEAERARRAEHARKMTEGRKSKILSIAA